MWADDFGQGNKMSEMRMFDNEGIETSYSSGDTAGSTFLKR